MLAKLKLFRNPQSWREKYRLEKQGLEPRALKNASQGHSQHLLKELQDARGARKLHPNAKSLALLG